MAKTKKEEKVTEKVIEQGGDMKMKAPKPKRPKQFVNKEEPDVIKVDLDKTKKEKVEDDTIKVDLTKVKNVKQVKYG